MNTDNELVKLTLPPLSSLLVPGKFHLLQQQLAEMNPADIALEMSDMSKPHMMLLFRLMPKELAAEVFSYLESEQHRQIVDAISLHEVQDLISEMAMDDAVDFLEELPANIVSTILNHTDHSTRNLINQFLNYADNSAGSLMTVEFVSLFESMDCRSAIEMIRQSGVNKETIYTCYVTDSERHLTGIVSLRTILVAGPETKIGTIMTPSPVCVNTSDDQEQVGLIFKKYDLISLPVVDSEHRIVGIVTIDDAIDVMEEEHTEDIEKMAAIKPSENEYLKTSVLRLAMNRLPWLLILMVSASIAEYLIEYFNIKVPSLGITIPIVALAVFLPMLMGTGGNCGSQASTLIVRSLAIGEVTLGDWLSILYKELRIGFLVGLILGLANLPRVIAVNFFSGNGWVMPGKLDIIVSFTLLVVVMVAKLTGCGLPLLAMKCKCDPALMASPLVTTIVDITALTIFYGITILCYR